MPPSPSPAQIFAARVRAAAEAYTEKKKKPLGGGFSVPPRKEVYAHVSREVGVAEQNVGFFLTYSRQCTHPWSAGACHLCPVPATYSGVYE